MKCNRCMEIKNEDEFYKSHKTVCKKCMIIKQKDYYQLNKECRLSYQHKYEKTDKGLITVDRRNQKRMEQIRNSTPPWSNKKELRDFYKNKPAGMSVNHIIPVGNKFVCGLNVMDNLEYIPLSENLRRGSQLPEANRWRKLK